jgi:hypothetical protein
MELLAHRGIWHQPDERNTLDALTAAFAAGWGVETDLRDLAGRVVISHDCPPANHELDLETLLSAWRDHDRAGRLALNVKADGLQGLVLAALEPAEHDRVFVFDASVPDERLWLRAGSIPTFVRHSELEPHPEATPHYALAAGVWLDAFDGPWWTAATVAAHLAAGRQVAIVSPELHGRDPQACWQLLADAGLWHRPGVLLCTDLPAAAATR